MEVKNIIIFLVVIGVLFMLMSYWGKEYYSYPHVYPTSYATLGGTYNSPLFNPTVSKRCAGGPYTYTSSPYLQAVCAGVSNSDLAQVACGKGFNGRPVKFDYSNLSQQNWGVPNFSSLNNGAWNNALCNTPNQSSLCVL